MKTSKFIPFFTMSVFFLSGCGPGQLFGPALTETPTSTLTSTPTITMAFTPTLTRTPQPTATKTPRPYLITSPYFEADKNTKPCPDYDHSIYEIQGEMFTLEGDFHIKRNSMWQLWCPEAVHAWIGELTYHGYTFTSDQKDPLQFKITPSGYRYIGGRGTIKEPDGTIVELP